MIKAFISHSSAQKQFAKRLVEKLGRDYCILDCYDFEPANRTLDEIYRKIDVSTVFVILLSKESVQSDWVKKEIQYAKDTFQGSEMNRFWPYIIDKNLSINECPEWIRNDQCFNLHYFESPQVLARDIEQKFRRIIWSKNARKRQIDTLMVGRNADIDEFEEIYHSSRGQRLKALVLSGRDGVGKDMFIQKCMDKIGYDLGTIPFSINLGAKEGIENYIIQLNLILELYDEEELMKVLAQKPSEKSKIAAKMTNEILKNRTVLTIEDNLVCVQANRSLSDWLVELVENSGLDNKLSLFIKSRKRPNVYLDTDHPTFAHLHLDPLDAKDRRKLFYSLIRIYKLDDVTDEDVQWFVDQLLLSPYQLVKAAEELSKSPVKVVKKDIEALRTWGDRKIKPMIDYFFKDEKSRKVLIVLSKMDFIS